MNYSVIIAEFNPLSNGHKKIIDKTKEMFPNDGIIVIMSGNFVQRGEPAIINKFSRAEVAVSVGVDAVIELPLTFAISSAEDFAYGSVKLASLIPGAKRLVFGSECGDIELLKETAKELSNSNTKHNLKDLLKSGLSFGTSLISALKGKHKDIMSHPNNILAVSYLQAIDKQNSPLDAVTITRENNFNSEELDLIPSASALRNAIEHNNIENLVGIMPEPMLKKIKDNTIPNLDKLFPIIFYKIETMSAESLSKIAGITEGFEYRLKKEFKKAQNYNQLVDILSSKRYPASKVKRILLNIIFDITKDRALKQKNSIPYLKALSVNSKSHVLSDLSKSSAPLLTKSKDIEKLPPELKSIFNQESIADNIYAIISNGDFDKWLKHKII